MMITTAASKNAAIKSDGRPMSSGVSMTNDCTRNGSEKRNDVTPRSKPVDFHAEVTH